MGLRKPKTLVIANREGKHLGGTGGNYVAKIQQLYQDGVLKMGSVANVTIAHDSWCGVYDQKPCNCDPDILLG